MQVSLTIIRYPGIFVPFALVAMVLHRIALMFNKNTAFYKLLGSGRNGSFDRIPDLQQWGILTVRSSRFVRRTPDSFGEVRGWGCSNLERNLLMWELYGSFIAKWFQLFSCETFTILLEPTEGHGLWDGKEVFGNLPKRSLQEGPVAILTRATIRLTGLQQFWKHINPVAIKMKVSEGFIMSLGLGEMPWIKQATFSIWESREAMMAFAYNMKEHTEVIKKTREQQWYSEELFVRFRIIGNTGTIKGIDPLKRNL